MGIKFLCPNGHKLHVKSYLSGKKAICPKCGARVVVPEGGTLSDASLDVPTASIEIPTEISQTLHAAAQSRPAMAPVATVPASPPMPKESAVDAFAEAPGAVWYVRPVSGGQFGPAPTEIMRGWVADGRVGASSLVWRAGWTEWRSAAEVFPQLSNLLVAPGAPLTAVPMAVPAGDQQPPPAPAESPAASLLTQSLRKRRRRNEVSLLASGVLVAVSVVLVIVLLVVFRAQSEPETSPEAQPADTAAAKP